MTRRGVLKAVAIWLGVALGIWLCAHETDAQRPEGALGYDADMPPIVGMTGGCEPRFVVGRGVLDGAAHEVEDGFLNVSTLSLAWPRDSIYLVRAREFRGQPVLVLIVPDPPRALKEIRR